MVCAAATVAALVGCGSSGASASGDDAPPNDAGIDSLPVVQPDFTLRAPPVELAPREEVTYCYYFHTGNDSDIALRKWDAKLMPGAHDVNVFFTRTDLEKPNTLSAHPCGFTTSGTSLRLVYAAQNPSDPSNAFEFPDDDGEGNHVGLPIAPGRSGFLQIHFINPTDAKLMSYVEVNAYGYHDNKLVTPAGPFVTYNTEIQIAPGTQAAPALASAGGECKVRPEWKFFSMSTHTHREGVESKVAEGTTALVTTTNWEKPQTTTWGRAGAPFYGVASGKLNYSCQYKNVESRRIFTGDTAATDETCIMLGFFFPSPDGAGAFCLDAATISPPTI